MKVLEIEDTSDCATCTARDKREWELLKAVKIAMLGLVPCHECGRLYEAMAAQEDVNPLND